MRTIMFATAMAALAPIAMSAPADARTRHHSVSHHRNVHIIATAATAATARRACSSAVAPAR